LTRRYAALRPAGQPPLLPLLTPRPRTIQTANVPAALPRTSSPTSRQPQARRRLVRGAVGFPSQRGDILLRERSSPMGETRRKFDRDFREGAVRLVRGTGNPTAEGARDLAINEGARGE